jgi:hypothetical protein
MNEHETNNAVKAEFHRFRVYKGKPSSSPDRPKTVGMAYLRAGQDMYTLRLWTFLEDKFFLIPSKKEAGRYLVTTREPTKNPNARTKYFWNIVGNASVDSASMCMEIDFDLFDAKLFMNLFPEAQTVAKNLPEPTDFESFETAA